MQFPDENMKRFYDKAYAHVHTNDFHATDWGQSDFSGSSFTMNKNEYPQVNNAESYYYSTNIDGYCDAYHDAMVAQSDYNDSGCVEQTSSSSNEDQSEGSENLIRRNARERKRVQAVNQAFANLRRHITVIPLGTQNRKRSTHNSFSSGSNSFSSTIQRHSRSGSQQLYTFPMHPGGNEQHTQQLALSLDQHIKKRISKVRTLKLAIDYIQYLIAILYDLPMPQFISNDLAYN